MIEDILPILNHSRLTDYTAPGFGTADDLKFMCYRFKEDVWEELWSGHSHS